MSGFCSGRLCVGLQTSRTIRQTTIMIATPSDACKRQQKGPRTAEPEYRRRPGGLLCHPATRRRGYADGGPDARRAAARAAVARDHATAPHRCWARVAELWRSASAFRHEHVLEFGLRPTAHDDAHERPAAVRGAHDERALVELPVVAAGRKPWWATFASAAVCSTRCASPSGESHGSVRPAARVHAASVAFGNSAKPYGSLVKSGVIERPAIYPREWVRQSANLGRVWREWAQVVGIDAVSCHRGAARATSQSWWRGAQSGGGASRRRRCSTGSCKNSGTRSCGGWQLANGRCRGSACARWRVHALRHPRVRPCPRALRCVPEGRRGGVLAQGARVPVVRDAAHG